MTKKEVLALLEQNKNTKNAEGMRKFGIKGNIYGISVSELRKIAKQIKKDHNLAMELWQEDVHEAKLLAILLADYKVLTEQEIDLWVKDFNSWDLVDQACANIYRYSELAIAKIPLFAKNENEFVRRTAFALIATMCFNRKIEDNAFLQYFPLIEKYSSDKRPMVYQAIDWAMRSMGKRRESLKSPVLDLAYRFCESEDKITRYIGKQSVKELDKGKKTQCVSLKNDTKNSLLTTKSTKKQEKSINPNTYSFDAVIIPDNEIDAAWIEFPYDVEKEFKKKRVKIHATFDNEHYDGLLVRMGTPCHIIGILKSIRKKIGKQAGDTVHVTVKERE